MESDHPPFAIMTPGPSLTHCVRIRARGGPLKARGAVTISNQSTDECRRRRERLLASSPEAAKNRRRRTRKWNGCFARRGKYSHPARDRRRSWNEFAHGGKLSTPSRGRRPCETKFAYHGKTSRGQAPNFAAAFRLSREFRPFPLAGKLARVQLTASCFSRATAGA